MSKSPGRQVCLYLLLALPLTLIQHASQKLSQSAVFGYSGQRAGELVDDVTILHTDSMKWVTPIIRGGSVPSPRVGHSAACCRDKVFVFGGLVSMQCVRHCYLGNDIACTEG